VIDVLLVLDVTVALPLTEQKARLTGCWAAAAGLVIRSQAEAFRILDCMTEATILLRRLQ
jgi:hypothetical protein